MEIMVNIIGIKNKFVNLGKIKKVIGSFELECINMKI